MTFTNSNNNNNEGKFNQTFSSSAGSPASAPATGGGTLSSTAGATLNKTPSSGVSSTLSSTVARPAGLGVGGSPASGSIGTPSGTTSAFGTSSLSKTVPLTSVSSATAARPASLSSTPATANTTAAASRPSAFTATATPASAGTTASAAKPSAFGSAATQSTATAAAPRTTTFSAASAHTSATSATSTATAARPSAFASTSAAGTAATASPRPSAFATTHASTAGATTAAARPSAFTSTAASAGTIATAARPSSFTASTTASAGSTIGTKTSAPVSSDEFAKKFAETKAALSTVKKAPLSSGSTDSGNVPPVAPGQEVSDVQYRRFAAFIEEKCGIVLGVGKQYLVNSRLSTLLSKFRISNVDELINKAMENTPNNKIQDAVIDAMTTNETLWFRDTYPYTALEQFILPELAKKGKYPVRIWSAACSSGQEPYSIGIVVQEQMAKMIHVDPKQTQIIGTDLSPEMLNTCKLGQYDVHALSRGLSAERKAKFFKPTRNPNIMQIDPRVKSMVEFRPMNLLGSYALMGKFDVIFCRNVLIYFSNDVKADILRKLTMCLNPEGYLILGSTETLVGVADKYEMVRHSPGILYRLKPQKYAF
ncbi:CheR family methyltransferase [Succinivibrio dextrinosolvens]|uniref:CheR family methyltransferase n=1 Tax=Succinivibrio dextrinosolvens TaxID=83771 RepID=UPI00247997A4|nr:protein-glutamate O-methyltransferase CheR [Succinivibrio dextrinosolvens]